MRPHLSVIVPTRDRAHLLAEMLDSLRTQTISKKYFEIIIVDNGHSNETSAVATEANKHMGNISIIREHRPGLHQGRHTGWHAAKSELLTFADDDILASPTWVESILDAFNQPDVALVGGNCFPKFDNSPPDGFDSLYENIQDGRCCGWLSLIEFDLKEGPMHPGYIYGCNYSIRRKILEYLGGFRPDGMPWSHIVLRGNGETGLGRFAHKHGFTAYFHPEAWVYHRVPQHRLTATYFYKRGFSQGISDSYSALRHFGLTQCPVQELSGQGLIRIGKQGIVDGFAFHRVACLRDIELQKWVLRSRYINIDTPQPPHFAKGPSIPPVNDLQQTMLTTKLHKDTDRALGLGPWAHNDLECLLLAKGAALLARGNPFKAADAFDQLLIRDKNNTAALTGLSNALLLQNKNKEALKILSNIVKAKFTPFAKITIDKIHALHFKNTYEDTISPKILNTHDERSRIRPSFYSEIYDSNFYRKQKDDSLKSAQIIAPVIQKIFNAKSIQDFGCGTGSWLKAFKSLQVSRILGYDLNSIDSKQLLVPHTFIRQQCDFTSQSFYPEFQSDLSICVEVAEHIPITHARQFIKLLTDSSPCIIFSAATCRQGGTHHVNEQPMRYWIDIFDSFKYKSFDILRPIFWNNNKINWWYRQNLIVFISQKFLDINPRLFEKINTMESASDMSFIHNDLHEKLCLSHISLMKIYEHIHNSEQTTYDTTIKKISNVLLNAKLNSEPQFNEKKLSDILRRPS